MKRGAIFLITIITMALLVSCSNKSEIIKSDVEDLNNQANISSETDKDHNNEIIKTENDLSQTEIVALLEEKEYLLRRFIIPYDDYRKIYMKYFNDGSEIDEAFLYMNVISDKFEWVPMRDFIGMDINETREYLESIGYPLEVLDHAENDELMHKVMISDVYNDNYNDWTYVFVQKEIQCTDFLQYGTVKYTFKKVDDDYNIIMKNVGYAPSFTKKALRKFSHEEINQIIENQPYKYINNELVKYTNTIDMKELVKGQDVESKDSSH